MEEREKWDKSAVDYQKTYNNGPSDYNQRLLGFLEENGMLYSGCRVIDVGCGVGKYGTFFAKRGCDVTLTDISGEMLRHARENMSAFTTPWRVFQCDFDEISAEAPELSGGFDLAVSTMSPAIHNVETVKKISAVTHGWCFAARFSSWEQPMREEFFRLLGLYPKPSMTGLEADCAGLIQAVSMAGYMPLVKYEPYNWCDARTPEDAADYILRRHEFDVEITDEIKLKAVAAARELADKNGLFHDGVNTKTAWIYWNTKEKSNG